MIALCLGRMIALCLAITTHIGLAGDWQNLHPCIRYEADAFTIGAFLNSENSLSLYSSYTFENGPWSLEAGLATGYSGAALIPILRGAVELDKNVLLFISPAYETVNKTFGVVLGVEIKQGWKI